MSVGHLEVSHLQNSCGIMDIYLDQAEAGDKDQDHERDDGVKDRD